jgi:cell division protein FtsZ
MTTNAETQTPALEIAGTPVIKIIGIGTAGVGLLETLNGSEFAGAARVAVTTEQSALNASTAPHKFLLENRGLRGLGTGGDAERGYALAEEHFATLKTACAGANVILLVAGLGGGAGSGITPVIARAARETGALVLGFVTLPFDCEGNRRCAQARASLDQIKAVADGVICLPSQKASKLIDENTSMVDTYRISGGLLTEAIRGVWQLMTRPGLIQIHLADLCALVRDKNSEGVFAFVESSGPARSREVVEKLLAHPLLDEGRALTESDAVLVSLMAGLDLTMGEVNRVMEQITRQCERAQVIMGAAVDDAWKNRLSVTVIAAKHSQPPAESAESATYRPGRVASRPTPTSGPSPLQMQQREQLIKQHAAGGRRKGDPKMKQELLPLVTITKGRFDKSEPTIHKGEDLDVPTYFRRGMPLN